MIIDHTGSTPPPSSPDCQLLSSTIIGGSYAPSQLQDKMDLPYASPTGLSVKTQVSGGEDGVGEPSHKRLRLAVEDRTASNGGDATASTKSEGPSGQRLYSCGRCSKSYARLDHLSRHVRMHTQEKPYQCQVCTKAFARADLLKRHALGHSKDNPQT